MRMAAGRGNQQLTTDNGQLTTDTWPEKPRFGTRRRPLCNAPRHL